MYDILELNKKLLPELREIGKDLKIKRVESYKKQDLIYKILDTQAIQHAEKKVQQAEMKAKPAQQKPSQEELPVQGRQEVQEAVQGQEKLPIKVKKSYKELIKQVVGKDSINLKTVTPQPEIEAEPEASPEQENAPQEARPLSRHEQLKAIMKEFSRDKGIKREKIVRPVHKQGERDEETIISESEINSETEQEEISEETAIEAPETKASEVEAVVEKEPELPQPTVQQPGFQRKFKQPEWQQKKENQGNKNFRQVEKAQDKNILDKNFEFDGIVANTGVLEIMPEGYGFLRSADFNYAAAEAELAEAVAQLETIKHKKHHHQH